MVFAFGTDFPRYMAIAIAIAIETFLVGITSNSLTNQKRVFG